MNDLSSHLPGRIGLALGSGAAKGWAHIGVIRALEARGIHPEVVCGSSMGAVVGAAYAAGVLDPFAQWGSGLEWRRMFGYFDLGFRGGLLRSRRLFEFFEENLPDQQIEDLAIPFAAVGTDLVNGQELWLREGSLLDALRATIALPGLIAPVQWQGRWLVDGGLVNPVPVSLCRALGADSVIAVDLNTTLIGRRLTGTRQSGNSLDGEADEALAVGLMQFEEHAEGERERREEEHRRLLDSQAWGEARGALSASTAGLLVDLAKRRFEPAFRTRLNGAFREFADDLRGRFAADEGEEGPELPSIYDVIANSINIMQMRIGRSRMAGDPPELLIAPRMNDFSLLDFDRAEEAMAVGALATEVALHQGLGAGPIS